LKTHFILIDLENVQPQDFRPLIGRSFKLRIFCGPTQTKIPVDIVAQLQPLGPDVEYVRSGGSGHNALDFHIAYYLGRLSAEVPEASFHIVSKDTGFDPLIKHLNGQGISCERVSSLSDAAGGLAAEHVKVNVDDLPAIAKPAPAPAQSVVNPPSLPAPTVARIQQVADRLLAQKVARPTTLKKLRTFIECQLNSETSQAAVDSVVVRLTQAGMSEQANGRLEWPQNGAPCC
jgi:hypothetical protein